MADTKFHIKTYNAISPHGLKQFPDYYKVSAGLENPDAILLRSYNLHKESIPASVLAIGRAGAGVNNIPVNEMSTRGVVVFNAPGANANSVKELVIAGMLLAMRNLPEGIEYTYSLKPKSMKEAVEAGKKKFVGKELAGKTIGVIGLGAIGYRVANAAVDLGMHVLGYDPVMTVQNAWQLSPAVQKVEDLNHLLTQSDIITLHVPLLDSTRGLLGVNQVKHIKPGSIVLNFSRDELVNEPMLVKSLEQNKINRYVTDFPNELTHRHPRIIALPHLGASTEEAEDNSAVMVASQVKDFLENGNIQFSVNFPSAVLPRKGSIRLTFAHKNEPGVVAQITNILGEAKLNILELLNNSRGNLAYTIVDLEADKVADKIVKKLSSIPQLLNLRVLIQENSA